MSVDWMDPGGEYYFSTGVSTSGVWSAIVGTPTLVNNAPIGRSTQYAISVSTTSAVDKSVSNRQSAVYGGAYYVNSGASFQGGNSILQTFDASTVQVDVRINNPAGTLSVTRNGTVLGTSTNALTLGQGWIYIELEVFIATGTGGSAQLWVNNVSWVNVTATNTQASANAFVNKFRFSSSIVTSANCFWKDMYVINKGSGSNTTRLSDSTVAVDYENSAGPSQQWTNSGASTQVACVQDGINHTGTWPDGDTTYISDATSGDVSDFGHQTLVSGTVFAVQHASYVRTDTGAGSVQQYTNSSGTIHTSGSTSPGSSYAYIYDILETDPNTSTAWTVSGFNSATFGTKIP